MSNEYIGSSFDSFLEEENISVEVKNEAIKHLISYNLLDEMKKQNINKTEMAKKNEHIQSSLRPTFKSSKRFCYTCHINKSCKCSW